MFALDVANNPPKKGYAEILIGGRPVDAFKLTNFMLFRTDQRTTPMLMHYNNAITSLEKDTYKKPGVRFNRTAIAIVSIILLVMIVFILIVVFAPHMVSGFSGIFGGMIYERNRRKGNI